MGGQGEKLEMVDIQAKRQRKGKQTGMILKKAEGEKKEGKVRMQNKMSCSFSLLSPMPEN